MQALAASDWIAVMQLIIGLIVAMCVQSFIFWRWLSGEFTKRDSYVQDQISERTRQLTGIRAELHLAKEQARTDVNRVDKDIAALNREVSIRLAQIPTRDVMEAMLGHRVQPLETDLRALVIELARYGFNHQPVVRRPFAPLGAEGAGA